MSNILLGNPSQAIRPARYLAMMQMVNILFLQVLSVVAGISRPDMV
jgi:hypothetical protein